MTTRTIPDAWSHLPTYRGLPVAYVAIWSTEIANPPLRHWRGMTWIHGWDHRGQGVPDFGTTHSGRQRAGMRRGRCQVCGRDGATTWVVPNDTDLTDTHARLWRELGWVLNPPLHRECFDLAMQWCPHLLGVEPLEVIHDRSHRRFMACTANLTTTGDVVMVTLDDAVNMPVIGRELIVELR
jgi:hypothetical protein